MSESAGTSRAPARPEELSVDLHEESDSFVVRRRRGGPWPFVLLMLVVWTFGCLDLLETAIDDASVFFIGFAVLFSTSWFFLAGQLIWMAFGKESIILRPDEVLFHRMAIVRLSSRVVPRSEVQGFRECQSRTQNSTARWGIEMTVTEKPLRFAFGLKASERAWLVWQLNEFLHSARPDANRHGNRNADDEDVGESPTDESDRTAGAAETLTLDSC